MADICHINGYCIKDRTARENIDKLSLDVENLSNEFENLNDEVNNINEHTTVNFFQTEVTLQEDVNGDGDGDGDISLIRTRDKTILIDVGMKTDLTVQNKLIEMGVNHIDYLIISHYHNDHIGGSRGQAIQAMIADGSLIDSETTFILPHSKINFDNLVNSQGVTKIAYLELKDLLQRNALNFVEPSNLSEIIIDENNKLTFYNLNEEDFNEYYNVTDSDGTTIYNNFSMVVLLESFKNRFLFTGDIQEFAQGKIARHIDYVDVYKFEHHGEETTYNTEYMKKISPSIAVCMPRGLDFKSSKFNPTATLIKNKGGKIFDTCVNGLVTVESSKGDLKVWSENGEVDKMNYHLGWGIRIPDGTDLNTLKQPGIYYSPTSSASETFINSPVRSCGFKMIVEKITHESKMVMQTIIEGNTSRRKVHKRKFISNLDNFTNWGSITYFKQFEETSSSAFAVVNENVEILSDNYIKNYVRQMNGVVDVSLKFKTLKAITSGSALFTIPSLQKEAFKTFLLYTSSGAIYPAQIVTSKSYPDGPCIGTLKAIPINTELYMSFTYLKDYKAED